MANLIFKEKDQERQKPKVLWRNATYYKRFKLLVGAMLALHLLYLAALLIYAFILS